MISRCRLTTFRSWLPSTSHTKDFPIQAKTAKLVPGSVRCSHVSCALLQRCHRHGVPGDIYLQPLQSLCIQAAGAAVYADATVISEDTICDSAVSRTTVLRMVFFSDRSVFPGRRSAKGLSLARPYIYHVEMSPILHSGRK